MQIIDPRDLEPQDQHLSLRDQINALLEKHAPSEIFSELWDACSLDNGNHVSLKEGMIEYCQALIDDGELG